jgi:hypothetical protein
MVNMADPAYCRTMRIPLIAGGAFSYEDRVGASSVAVISEEIGVRGGRTLVSLSASTLNSADRT